MNIHGWVFAWTYLLGHMITLCLSFWGSQAVSTAAALFYIPANSVSYLLLIVLSTCRDKVKQVTSKAKSKRWDKCGLACSCHCILYLGNIQWTDTMGNYPATWHLFINLQGCPGWCSSVDWAWACEPKGCWFNSQSGHMPGLQARSPVVDAWEATTHWCFFPSLSPSLPLSLKINK